MYKEFVKQSSTDDRKSLGITVSLMTNSSSNKSVTPPTEDLYYNSNECYTMSKSDKEKVLNACSNRNGGKKSKKSGGKSKSGGGS